MMNAKSAVRRSRKGIRSPSFASRPSRAEPLLAVWSSRRSYSAKKGVSPAVPTSARCEAQPPRSPDLSRLLTGCLSGGIFALSAGCTDPSLAVSADTLLGGGRLHGRLIMLHSRVALRTKGPR